VEMFGNGVKTIGTTITKMLPMMEALGWTNREPITACFVGAVGATSATAVGFHAATTSGLRTVTTITVFVWYCLSINRQPFGIWGLLSKKRRRKIIKKNEKRRTVRSFASKMRGGCRIGAAKRRASE